MTNLEKINSAYKHDFLKMPFELTKEEYSKEELLKLIRANQKNNSRYSIDYWLYRGYSEDVAKIKVKEIKAYESATRKKKLPQCKEYYTAKGYSEEDAKQMAKEYSNIRSVRCVEYYLNKGYNEKDAIMMLKKSQNNSEYIDYDKRVNNTDIEYYLNKGYNEKEAKQKLKERQSTFSLEKCIEKYGKEKGLEVFNERQEKWQETLNSKSQEEIDDMNRRKNYSIYKNDSELKKIRSKIKNTRIKRGLQLSDEQLSDFEVYSKRVWIYTRANNLSLLSNFDKRGRIDLKNDAYHLDHKFSIYQGFKNNIPPWIIGSIYNLEMIPATKNCGKGGKCSLDKDSLFSSFFKL